MKSPPLIQSKANLFHCHLNRVCLFGYRAGNAAVPSKLWQICICFPPLLQAPPQHPARLPGNPSIRKQIRRQKLASPRHIYTGSQISDFFSSFQQRSHPRHSACFPRRSRPGQPNPGESAGDLRPSGPALYQQKHQKPSQHPKVFWMHKKDMSSEGDC